MDSKKIQRINELAKKSKESALSESELREQKELREEYIQSYRNGVKQTLENVVIVDEHGNRRKLRKK